MIPKSTMYRAVCQTCTDYDKRENYSAGPHYLSMGMSKGRARSFASDHAKQYVGHRTHVAFNVHVPGHFN